VSSNYVYSQSNPNTPPRIATLQDKLDFHVRTHTNQLEAAKKIGDLVEKFPGLESLVRFVTTGVIN
jgi:hypothetical protein